MDSTATTASRTSTTEGSQASAIVCPLASALASADAKANNCCTCLCPPNSRKWNSSEIKALCDGVFVLGGGDANHAQQVCDALAKAPGCNKKLAEEVAWTELPYDFLIDKDKYKEDEMVDRYGCIGLKAFTKKNEVEKANLELDKNLLAKRKVERLTGGKYEQFSTRLRRFRKNIINYMVIEIHRWWGIQFKALVKDVECKSFDGFLVLFRTQTYNKRMRFLVFLCQNGMWTREIFIWMEAAMMGALKITYLPGALVSNKPIKNKR